MGPSVARDYPEAWRKYRRRWYWFCGLFVGSIVLGMGISSLGFERIGPAVGIVLMVAALVVSMFVQSFRCPRCGKFFYGRGNYINTLSSQCLNCGLPKRS